MQFNEGLDLCRDETEVNIGVHFTPLFGNTCVNPRDCVSAKNTCLDEMRVSHSGKEGVTGAPPALLFSTPLSELHRKKLRLQAEAATHRGLDQRPRQSMPTRMSGCIWMIMSVDYVSWCNVRFWDKKIVIHTSGKSPRTPGPSFYLFVLLFYSFKIKVEYFLSFYFNAHCASLTRLLSTCCFTLVSRPSGAHKNTFSNWVVLFHAGSSSRSSSPWAVHVWTGLEHPPFAS